MKISMLALVAAMLLIPFVCNGYEDGDWQFWHSETVEVKMSDMLKARIGAEFRTGDDMGEHYYQHTDIGAEASITGSFSIYPFYRQVYTLVSGERWKKENRYNLDFKNKFGWFSNRFRVEYRDLEADDTFRYRNKMAIDLPFNTYLADELFSDNDEIEVKRNELSAGVKIKLFKLISLDVFYLLADEKNAADEWIDSNVLGIYGCVKL